MGERAKAVVVRSLPWQQGVAWPVVAIEGVALLAVGLFMALRPDTALDAIRVLLGIVLLVMSVQQIGNAFRNPGHPFALFQMLRGGVGATIGLLVAIEPLFRAFTPEAARIVLGVGLLVVGALGLIGLLYVRSAEAMQIESVVTAALTIAFGLVVLGGGGGRAPLLGWAAVGGGVALIVYAAVLLRSGRTRGVGE